MKPVLYGTIVVGTLDAIDAIVVFGLRGSTPIRVFQGIASGWLGRAVKTSDIIALSSACLMTSL